ncbi:hypothetical protein GCM10023178_76570 [Actinomadura luteofluorescens]
MCAACARSRSSALTRSISAVSRARTVSTSRSLDAEHQRVVAELVERRRRDHGTTVVFVTHEIDPVLPFADRILDMGAAPGAQTSRQETA